MQCYWAASLPSIFDKIKARSSLSVAAGSSGSSDGGRSSSTSTVVYKCLVENRSDLELRNYLSVKRESALLLLEICWPHDPPLGKTNKQQTTTKQQQRQATP